MPLIIDGNNLLHASKPRALAGLDERGLCRALGCTHWRREGVRVVCDGEPGPLGRVDSPVPDVELIYSGHNRSADAVIERMIATSTAPRRLIVVSSDHRIRRAATRRRARAWTSEHFARELARALAARSHQRPDPGASPDTHLSPGEVERWLKAFGYELDDFEGDEGSAHGRQREDDDDDSKYWPPW